MWSDKKENGIAHKKQNCPQKEKKRTVEILQFSTENKYDEFKVKKKGEKNCKQLLFMHVIQVMVKQNNP